MSATTPVPVESTPLDNFYKDKEDSAQKQ